MSSITEAKSVHVADKSVQPFLQRTFDPVDYLNNALPNLSSSTSTVRAGQNNPSVPLNELSTQLQTLLSQLNAQTSRLSTALTQLADEIIRGGGKLAYEVDVLRGETTSLTELWESGLRKDVELLSSVQEAGEPDVADEDHAGPGVAKHVDAEPEYMQELKNLTNVRSKLDSVIKVFGDAMSWPIAPSELSITSSFITVSAPDSNDDSRSREEKGKAYAEKLRADVDGLIGAGDDPADLEAAADRVDELRRLIEVWKGTVEEKPRMKLVEGLHKHVEERQRAWEKSNAGRAAGTASPAGIDYRYGTIDSSSAISEGGYGFLQNLRSLKNDMYLE